jgi:hypothetical protein
MSFSESNKKTHTPSTTTTTTATKESSIKKKTVNPKGRTNG